MESTSWNFPAKIKNSLRPIPSFDMMSKFPGSDHSCRRRYVAKLFVGKKKKNREEERERHMLASICGSRSQKPRKQYSRTVKRLFTGFQTNFQRLWRNIGRKPLKSHATVVGGQATVGRLSISVFSTFQATRNFVEKVAERSRDSGRRSRDRRPTVKQRFLDLSSNLGKFRKKSLNGHATVVGGHATVDRLSNNVFWTFQAIWENFEKSR